MPSGSEFKDRTFAAIETGTGVLVQGAGVKVNPTVITAPYEEGMKILGSVGTGNVPEVATTTAHAAFDLINVLVHAGPSAVAAGITIVLGLLLFGKGRVDSYKARRAAGKVN